MSVLINMEMPTSCQNCRFCDGQADTDYGVCAWCDVDGNARDAYTMQDCPLVPVPPHGRLIDEQWLKDAMITTLEALKKNPKMDRQEMHLIAAFDTLRAMVEDAPTIIPASEEGAKAEEDTEPWLCLSCRHYPPSSTDGKPCSQCDPIEVWHSCYDPAEEGE